MRKAPQQCTLGLAIFLCRMLVLAQGAVPLAKALQGQHGPGRQLALSSDQRPSSLDNKTTTVVHACYDRRPRQCPRVDGGDERAMH